jgi:predicted DNA-binding transcriptional regulator YafY
MRSKRYAYRPTIRRLRFLVTRLADGPVTTRALAAEYEVSQKTLHRDFDLLRDIGLDIVGDKHGMTLRHHGEL